MSHRTDARAFSSLAIRLIEGVMPKKRKEFGSFYSQDERHDVPLVNVLNNSKLYALEKVDFFCQCIDFLSFPPLFFSSMWCPAPML